MVERINSLLSIFDVGDLKFFLLVAKKNLKNLLILSSIISLLVFIISLNQEKIFKQATIVIEPDENKIVNIEEVYSIEAKSNRINNQMAILKSDEVQEYIVNDKKNSTKFRNLYSEMNKSFFQRIFSKIKKLIIIF